MLRSIEYAYNMKHLFRQLKAVKKVFQTKIMLPTSNKVIFSFENLTWKQPIWNLSDTVGYNIFYIYTIYTKYIIFKYTHTLLNLFEIIIFTLNLKRYSVRTAYSVVVHKRKVINKCLMLFLTVNALKNNPL